jgi:hypothetical protein
MKDLKKLLIELHSIFEARMHMLAETNSSNYIAHNKKCKEANSMVPVTLVIQGTKEKLDGKLLPYALRVEQLAKAVGIYIVFKEGSEY